MNIVSRIRIVLFLCISHGAVEACDSMFQLVVEDKQNHACLVACRVFDLGPVGLPNVCLVKAADCAYVEGQQWPPYIAMLYAAWWIATHTDARAICMQEELIADSGCASYIAMLPGVNQDQHFKRDGLDGKYWSVALDEEIGFFLGGLLHAALKVGSVVCVRELFEQMWQKLVVRMCNADKEASHYTIVANWAYDQNEGKAKIGE